MNWTAKGQDGNTPYHRVRSKPFVTKLLRFGEICRFKNRAHEPLSATGDGRRWHTGVFIGVDRRTGQYMIHGGDEVKYARTVLRMPEANKFDKDELGKIASTPWDLHKPRDLEVVFKEKKEATGEVLQDKVAISRQVYIKPADLERFGLTKGCPRCEHQISHGPGRTSKPHSHRCRARIMDELAKTPEGQARIGAAADRLDRTAADMGEQHRADIPQRETGEMVHHLPDGPPI